MVGQNKAPAVSSELANKMPQRWNGRGRTCEDVAKHEQTAVVSDSFTVTSGKRWAETFLDLPRGVFSVSSSSGDDSLPLIASLSLSILHIATEGQTGWSASRPNPSIFKPGFAVCLRIQDPPRIVVQVSHQASYATPVSYLGNLDCGRCSYRHLTRAGQESRGGGTCCIFLLPNRSSPSPPLLFNIHIAVHLFFPSCLFVFVA